MLFSLYFYYDLHMHMVDIGMQKGTLMILQVERGNTRKSKVSIILMNETKQNKKSYHVLDTRAMISQ